MRLRRFATRALTGGCLAALTAAAPALAANPGDNGRIAFVRGADGATAIWTMEPDSSDAKRLTTAGGENSSPAWSPDGTRIAFSSNRDGDYDIWIMNADGSDQRRVTNEPTGEFEPTFSPDGRQIAYSDDRETTGLRLISEIWAVGVDGSGARPLTNLDQFSETPSWAPDNSFVAFASRGALADEIWRVPPGGGDASLITFPQAGSFQRQPDWAPDSGRLAFAADGDILSATRFGSDVRSATTGDDLDSEPAWSPDGQRIAYTRRPNTPEGVSLGDIWIAPAPGGPGAVRVASDPLPEREPSWQPKIRPTTPQDTPPPGQPGPPTPSDLDGDGFSAAQGDCNDGSASISPVAPEVPGNAGDENCDGRSDPYPVVSARASMTGQRDPASKRVFVLGLRVNDLTGGETVTVSCARRCSQNLRRFRVAAAPPDTVRLRRARGGWVRFGSALRVRIERAGYSTRIQTFTMRPTGRIPWLERRRCELPGGAGDRDCDGAPDVPLLPARASLDTARRGRDTELRRLRLRDLQGGEFVALACKGKGCARRLTRTQTVASGTTRLRLDGVVRGVRLKPGARLELTISKTGFATSINRWTMRRGGGPRAARLCLEPGDNRAGSCG